MQTLRTPVQESRPAEVHTIRIEQGRIRRSYTPQVQTRHRAPQFYRFRSGSCNLCSFRPAEQVARGGLYWGARCRMSRSAADNACTAFRLVCSRLQRFGGSLRVGTMDETMQATSGENWSHCASSDRCHTDASSSHEVDGHARCTTLHQLVRTALAASLYSCNCRWGYHKVHNPTAISTPEPDGAGTYH